MIHVNDEFLPDEEKHVVYDRLYREIYCKIFDSLVPLYEKINRIIKKEFVYCNIAAVVLHYLK